jgi:aldehyde:ferredoxin oxidoreductase
LAARLLYDHLSASLDALDPRSALLFLTGPFSGTSGPAVGRLVVCARSPQTGLWGEANCGGFLATELRRAGLDGLWITGRASHPVVLHIVDNQVSLLPAADLWGLDTYQTQAAIQAQLGPAIKGASIAAIGSAGESLLPFALILADHGRVAGRTGMGAVMGSKNLKAIVVRGSGNVPVASPEAYKLLRGDVNRMLRKDATSAVARELGTAGVAEYFDYLAEMPKRYFQRGEFPGVENVSGAAYSEKYLAGVSACHACVIACGRVVRLPAQDGTPGEKRKGPEYETVVGFGPNLLIDDPVFITRMGELCDRYGMDTISLSNVIGLAFHLYEKGLITLEDTGGLRLTWGDQSAVEQLVHQTARRESLGARLAQGARAFAASCSAESEAVQVKGLEAAYHDPRGGSGMALVYATSPIGGSHNHSDYYLVDIGQVEPALGMRDYPRLAGAEKAANVALHQDWRAVFNALVMCLFANVDPEQVLELVNLACGTERTMADLLKVGERAFNLKRMLNYRLGMPKAADTIPAVFQQPFTDNPPGIPEGTVPDFPAMLAAYYQARGWDAHGVPTPQKLADLGLEWTNG